MFRPFGFLRVHQTLRTRTSLNGCRNLATATDILPSTSQHKLEATSDQLDVEQHDTKTDIVETDPNHGLADFFRVAAADDIVDDEVAGKARKGKQRNLKLVTLQVQRPNSDPSGREWRSEELRRKSFEDLHALWYILLRERNLLATQKAEARRFGVQPMGRITASADMRLVKKSMANIKLVLNERRLAYEGALSAFAKDKEALSVSRNAPEETLAETGSEPIAEDAPEQLQTESETIPQQQSRA